jgi:class 3 adenylate cyclase
MLKTTEKLAVLFADICGSTALYDSLGDDRARRLIARCIATMSAMISGHQGRLVKTIGDEIMCTFPTAELALHAAGAMQSAVEDNAAGDDPPLHIRVGFHYGEVIHENNDVFGDTVNVAARVASIARAAQIMTTQAAVDALPTRLQEKARKIMRAELKGKQAQFELFVVTWGEEDMQSTRIGIPAFRKPTDHVDEMVLHCNDQSVTVNWEHRSVVVGRSDTCDIVVQNDFTSRQHIRIELRFGKFVLIDQSTNGTYVRSSTGHVVTLSREDMILQGSGSISLGQPYANHPTTLIEFVVTSHSLGANSP